MSAYDAFGCVGLPRKLFPLTALSAGAFLLTLIGGVSLQTAFSPTFPGAKETPGAAEAPKVGAVRYGGLLVDLRSHARAPTREAQSAAPELRLASLPPAPSAPMPEQQINPPSKLATVLQPDDETPLPPRRPAEVARANPGSPQVALRPSGRQSGRTVLQAAPADNRNFFEKLFGAPQSAGPALAYAAPENGSVSDRPSVISPGAAPRYDHWTAVYDISAHTVYLPNGTKLEAHSGLGARLDDPRYVNERMRGATPPNVYELTPREALFHGVPALRLTPVGGGTVYGRSGLLAHTYMLGPNGDSNGCVSFRNYAAFLQAYRSGEIKRLAVVARVE